jgi:wobble nucleotide-excising tRNase
MKDTEARFSLNKLEWKLDKLIDEVEVKHARLVDANDELRRRQAAVEIEQDKMKCPPGRMVGTTFRNSAMSSVETVTPFTRFRQPYQKIYEAMEEWRVAANAVQQASERYNGIANYEASKYRYTDEWIACRNMAKRDLVKAEERYNQAINNVWLEIENYRHKRVECP